MSNFIAKELKEADNVTCLIREYKDPMEKYETEKSSIPDKDDGTKQKLEDLDPIEQMILKEKVKAYTYSLKLIQTNVQRMYGYIWGSVL